MNKSEIEDEAEEFVESAWVAAASAWAALFCSRRVESPGSVARRESEIWQIVAARELSELELCAAPW